MYFFKLGQLRRVLPTAVQQDDSGPGPAHDRLEAKGQGGGGEGSGQGGNLTFLF